MKLRGSFLQLGIEIRRWEASAGLTIFIQNPAIGKHWPTKEAGVHRTLASGETALASQGFVVLLSFFVGVMKLEGQRGTRCVC